MASIDEFIDELKSWIDTPFYLNGRTKDGVDCIGLVLKSAQKIGLELGRNADFVRYNQVSSYRAFIQDFQDCCKQFPISEIQRGDIIHYKGAFGLNHIAVYIDDNTIIGAMDYVGKVMIVLEFDRSTVKDGMIWRPNEFIWQH